MADVTLTGPSIDAETWMWLPDVFPTEFHASADAWLAETGEFIRGFSAPDATAEECLRTAAAVLATGAGRADALARFWHVPPTRATLSIVSVLAWDDSADDRPLSERCLDGLEEGALQSMREIDHPAATEAVATVAVARSGSHDGLTLARWMARRDGVILVVEAIVPAESAPVLLLAMTPDLDRLFVALSVWP